MKLIKATEKDCPGLTFNDLKDGDVVKVIAGRSESWVGDILKIMKRGGDEDVACVLHKTSHGCESYDSYSLNQCTFHRFAKGTQLTFEV